MMKFKCCYHVSVLNTKGHAEREGEREREITLVFISSFEGKLVVDIHSWNKKLLQYYNNVLKSLMLIIFIYIFIYIYFYI